MTRRIGNRLLCSALLIMIMLTSARAYAEIFKVIEKEGAAPYYAMELELHPMPEPRPAFKHRLMTPEHQLKHENAALHYLQAQAFLEQHAALREIFKRQDQYQEEDRNSDGDLTQRPYAWIGMSPEDLPMDEVKDYMRLVEFQTRYLKKSVLCDHCDFENNIRGVEDPMYVLLPEIQAQRELARMQVIRGKVAIAERRFDDAEEIMRQNYMMAWQLGKLDCLVTNFVGNAISRMTHWYIAADYIQQPGAPNLYWALSAMRSPLIDMRLAMSTESEWFTQQFEQFREVDETARPITFWRQFSDDFADEYSHFDYDETWWLASRSTYESNNRGIKMWDDMKRPAMTGIFIAAYPDARRYLIEDWEMPELQVDAYPIAQVVALAMLRCWEESSDAEYKYLCIPIDQHGDKFDDIDRDLEEISNRIGVSAHLTDHLLPALEHAAAARTRMEQSVAALRTIEAIRLYGASHESQLPATLDDLEVPVPIDPFSGDPLPYSFNDDHAVLILKGSPGYERHITIRFAEPGSAE